jgi:hypothetical protein
VKTPTSADENLNLLNTLNLLNLINIEPIKYRSFKWKKNPTPNHKLQTPNNLRMKKALAKAKAV